jgi:YggT family protein
VVLDAASEVKLFVIVFVSVYSLLIIVYVLTSWVRLPYSLSPVQRFLDDVCEPYLRLWRRVLPSAGPLDFSPIVALAALWILEQVVLRVI